MNTRFLLLTLALLFPVQLYARDKTDIMVMTNGDRLTCEVKGLDAGVLYVSFDYIEGSAVGKQATVCRENGGRHSLHGDISNSRYSSRPARKDSGPRCGKRRPSRSFPNRP